MMNKDIFDRRRLLQSFMLGSLAVSAAALAGCTPGTGATRPRRLHGGGGGGEKSGNNGGAGNGGNHAGK